MVELIVSDKRSYQFEFAAVCVDKCIRKVCVEPGVEPHIVDREVKLYLQVKHLFSQLLAPRIAGVFAHVLIALPLCAGRVKGAIDGKRAD